MRPEVPPGIHPATGNPVLPSLAAACADLASTGSPVLQAMAASVARGELAITVRFASVYGLVKCYPVCGQALLFSLLTRTKTFRPEDLDAIRRLGFTVRLSDGSRELLQRFVAGA